MGDSRSVYRFWWGNLRERPPGRPRRRWEKNLKMGLHELGCGGVDWIYLVEERDRWRAFVNAVIKKCGEFLD